MPDEIRVSLLIDNDFGGTMKTVKFAKKKAPQRLSVMWERVPIHRHVVPSLVDI